MAPLADVVWNLKFIFKRASLSTALAGVVGASKVLKPKCSDWGAGALAMPLSFRVGLWRGEVSSDVCDIDICAPGW